MDGSTDQDAFAARSRRLAAKAAESAETLASVETGLATVLTELSSQGGPNSDRRRRLAEEASRVAVLSRERAASFRRRAATTGES